MKMLLKRRFFIGLAVEMIQLLAMTLSFADPIHVAAREGNTAEVSRLIDEDRNNRHAVDSIGSTPLHWASMNGHIATVRVLLDGGADFNATTLAGHTPLYWAASRDHNKKIVQALLVSGANVEALDKFGDTPLHEAARNCCLEIVQILLAAGANIHAANHDGDRPFQLAMDRPTAQALQPQVVARTHTQTAFGHTETGMHDLAARSHTWAAQALSGTEEAKVSYMRAAESHFAAGNHGAAFLSYASAGMHPVHAHTLIAERSTSIALGLSGESAAEHYIKAMQSHFNAAEIHARARVAGSDETDASLADAQAQECLGSAGTSEAQAVRELDSALVAIDGALEGAITEHEARAADARAAHLAQYTSLVDSLRRDAVRISSKVEEIRANAGAGRQRVSAARAF